MSKLVKQGVKHMWIVKQRELAVTKSVFFPREIYDWSKLSNRWYPVVLNHGHHCDDIDRTQVPKGWVLCARHDEMWVFKGWFHQ